MYLEDDFKSNHIGARVYLRTGVSRVGWVRHFSAFAWGTRTVERGGTLVIYIEDRNNTFRNLGIKRIEVEVESTTDYEDPSYYYIDLDYVGSLRLRDGNTLVHAFAYVDRYMPLSGTYISGWDGFTTWKLSDESGNVIEYCDMCDGVYIGTMDSPTVVGINYGDWHDLELIDMYKQ